MADNQHHLSVTTRGFLEYAGLRDLADLPPLAELDEQDLGVLSHRP